MKNVISFSLWGDNPLYTHGAIHNIKLANKLYPDWICRFYIDPDTTPTDIVQQIVDSGSEVIYRYNNRDTLGMMWRFEVMFDPDVDRFIIRDADSRIYYRECVAVNEWISSGKAFHIMRDHQYHNIAICGGMWGGQTLHCMEYASIYNAIINDPRTSVSKGADQEFLQRYLWQKVRHNMLCHDRAKNYSGCNGEELSFTIPLEDNLHVGCIVDPEETGESAYAKYRR